MASAGAWPRLGLDLPTTKPFTVVLALAGHEALELGDRLGTEHLLLGVAREGDRVAAQALERTGAGFLQLQEAVLSLYAAGVELEPFPLTGDRRPGSRRPEAQLDRVLPLAGEHPLPSGDLLVLLSLEIWSDWFDLRYAITYATQEPEGDLPRPSVLGNCEVSDRAGTEYVNWVTARRRHGPHLAAHLRAGPAAGHRGAGGSRFLPPSAAPGKGRPLVVSTVVL